MKESLDFYRQLSDDNRSRLEEVLKRNDELEEEFEDSVSANKRKVEKINVNTVKYNFFFILYNIIELILFSYLVII